MAKKFKIYDEEDLIYEGILSVNTAILKGRLAKDPQISGKAVHFSLQISGGKNNQTNEWNKPTYADCSAFGELGEQIFKRYCGKDEIRIIAKFYSNVHDGKFYKGFNVREVINMKSESSKSPDGMEYIFLATKASAKRISRRVWQTICFQSVFRFCLRICLKFQYPLFVFQVNSLSQIR